jgi:hypothetical protein
VTSFRLSASLLLLAALSTAVACDTRPALSFSPDSLPDATLGVPYGVTISVAGNQTPVGDFFAESGLPPGLSLAWDEKGDRNAAVLSGTPTAPGTYNFTISAWCLGTNVNGQTGSHEYALIVRSAAPTP